MYFIWGSLGLVWPTSLDDFTDRHIIDCVTSNINISDSVFSRYDRAYLPSLSGVLRDWLIVSPPRQTHCQSTHMLLPWFLIMVTPWLWWHQSYGDIKCISWKKCVCVCSYLCRTSFLVICWSDRHRTTHCEWHQYSFLSAVDLSN